MKRLLLTLVVLMILAVSFDASGQTAGAEKIVADIPFAFNVGQLKLPAGKYTFMVLNPASDRKILQIRSMKKGRPSAIVHASIVNARASDDAKLVFRRYGDRYFFNQAQVAGGSTALAAVMSNAERAEREAIGAAGKKPDLVSIAGK